MIVCDLSQTLTAAVLISVKKFPDVNENDLRFMALRSIGSYLHKFRKDYGELIICCDSYPSWRKSIFPYYKANRVKNKLVDWDKFREITNKIISELDENFPYRVIKVDNAEGDDIMAVLVMENINSNNKMLIVSADKDLSQLQKYSNVEQYDPIFTKVKFKIPNPETFLKEKIIRGDRGDGIPNILSNDDTFVSGSRQTPIRSEKVKKWIELNSTQVFNERELRNYKRNERLISFDFIPQSIKDEILEQFKEQGGKKKDKILPYFMKHKMNKLLENIGDY